MKTNETNNEDLLISLREASELLCVSKDTLRNWDTNGKLVSVRTQGGHRRYRKSNVLEILNENKVKGSMDNKSKIVVYAYVCGDILHKGHILYLKNCKALGDILMVGVLTDEAITEKKPAPLIKFEERIEIVECLKMVDIAVPQHTYAPHDNVRNMKPDILVESTSHSQELIDESKKCIESIGGKMIISSYYPYQSSNSIKNKIKKREKK